MKIQAATDDIEVSLEDTRRPLDVAHEPSDDEPTKHEPRKWTCRRRMGMFVIFAFLGVCGAIAGIVTHQYRATSNSTASGIQDYGGGGNHTCNGLAANCQRKVNEIMYATVHNAYSALDDNFLIAYNNILSLEKALEAGFRALMLDTCWCKGVGAALCHTTCSIGYRRVVGTFEAIRDFMNNNPNEVVIIELQVGEDSFDPFYEELKEVEGLFELMYQHPNVSTPWPLISELVQNNTRLIFFQHDGPDCDTGECPYGFHDTYTYMFETPFNSSGFEGLMDFEKTCVHSRGRYLRTAPFMISNHFGEEPPLGLPDQSCAEKANLAENIRNRTDACTEMLNHSTNLLVVDFWSIGDTLEVVQEYNSLLPDITQSPTMSPFPSASPTRSPSISSPSPTKQPVALPTSQPSSQTTSQPTAAASEVTAIPSVISTGTDMPTTPLSVTSSATQVDYTATPSSVTSSATQVDYTATPSSVTSSATQVDYTAVPPLSIASTPGPSSNEVTGTVAPTLSTEYSGSLSDYTS